MKKLIAILFLGISVSAFAHGYVAGHGYYRPHHGGWGWVAPVIVGGVIGYEIARPPVVIQQPPVVVQQQNCSPWSEIRNSDGSVTVTRTCNQ